MTRPRTVVVVGGSVAGVRCATDLRAEADDVRVVLVEAESGHPYDKPQLSKRLGDDAELALLATAETLAGAGIEFRPGTGAWSLDVPGRVLETSSGPLPYDELVIATGCRPRELAAPLPAAASSVRTRDDWNRLREAVRGQGSLVVVGAGFLGLEVAAAATRAGVRATVVDVAPRILTRGVPQAAADLIADRHADEGVELRLGADRPTVTAHDGGVVVDHVAADFAVVAVGAVPALDWLDGSGLEVADGVVAGADLAVAPGVWAIGDCVRWRNARYDRAERHEHWTTAVRQAQHVARSIAASTTSPFGELPYVWSDQHDWRIQTVGHVGTDEHAFRTEAGAPVVLSLTDDRVTGVTTINAPGVGVAARRALVAEDPPIDRLVVDLRLTTAASA